MYCGKCGAQVNPQEKFCGSCGAAIEQKESLEDNLAFSSQKSKKKHKLIGITACAIVVLLIGIGVFAIIFNHSEKPEVVAEKYLQASIDFDYDTISKYSAYDFESYMKLMLTYFSASEDEIEDRLFDEYGMTDIKKIFQGPLKEKAYERLKNKFGADYEVSVNITGSTELSNSEMNDQLEKYSSEFSELNELIDLDKMKAMCRVRGRITIEGSEYKDSKGVEMYCVKVGRKWKAFSLSY